MARITFDRGHETTNGAVSFDYTIEDADGDASNATVEINVDPVNDLPVATDDINLTDVRRYGAHRQRP